MACQTREGKTNLAPIQIYINTVTIDEVIRKGRRATVKHKGWLVTQQGPVTTVSKSDSVDVVTIDLAQDDRAILSHDDRISEHDSSDPRVGCQGRKVLDQDIKD